MYSLLSTSILLANIQLFACNYLEAAANYQKPKLERNNIVNKGVWVRNKHKDKLFEKTSLGNVVFRPTSLDADRLSQTSFDTFADNVMEDSPFVSAYMERARRSTDQMRKRLSRKSIKNKKLKYSVESTTNSGISNLKPTSVFNGYTYKTILLNPNNDRKELPDIHYEQNVTNVNTTLNNRGAETNATETDPDHDIKNITEAIEATFAESYIAAPKRSRKHNYGVDNDEHLEFVEDFNRTEDNSKVNREIMNQDDHIWHQNAPIPDTHVYEVVPKDKSNKAVTERGLIKVISMLTKTFKKIMKQHSEVKRMYEKFNTMNEDFVKQVDEINKKFQDFDSKYSDMIQFNDKLKALEDKLTNEEGNLKNKHKEMDNNIVEFENQQKKFLAQQKQFYTIQKVMLAQNEKIHLKQSMIAKTQSEISHRQNNFARILKKTKQLFIDSKKQNHTKETKGNNDKFNKAQDTKTIKTEILPLTVETIKLNLFSIPTKNKLRNQDELIIKEKDQKPIDDLVYKYYFNNTFIDNLMKSKILNNYPSSTNSIEIARNIKNKRDELETTLLLPINPKDKPRVRRYANLNDLKDEGTPKGQVLKLNPDFMNKKTDPFFIMAKSFCNEIGQNSDAQALNWCVEKALRRLRFMDKKLFPQPVTVMKEQTQMLQKKAKYTTDNPRSTLLPFAPTTVWLATSLSIDPVSTPLYTVPNQGLFFPDNEELESNLKQFDLTPDSEGTVYYDGSLHLSDFAPNAHSAAHSNSQDEMNPIAVDLKSKRQAYVKRLNEDFMKRNRKL